MEINQADRISKIKPYIFADLGRKIAQLKKTGMDVIRLDIGSPDLPPADFIIEALVDAARQPDMHGYGQPGGSMPLKEAMAENYGSKFGVELDPEKEVLALIGSKEGIINLTNVFINPGDLVLLPDPFYPAYEFGVIVAQAEAYRMPLLVENGFLPDLNAIPEDIARRAKLIWLDYPNNPTGAIAPLSFFEEVIAFARKYDIVIAHDAPYLEICFGQDHAPSMLQIPGAKDLVIEFNSLSKTYNMAGWRVGMAVGNPDLIRLLKIYKSQCDSSIFKPIMKAAEVALRGDQSWILEKNQIYKKRRDVIVETLQELGFSLNVPQASLYIWAKIPAPWHDSAEFCDKLLREAGVSVTPGVVYGKSGEGYVRISLVTPVEVLKEAMQRLSTWVTNPNKMKERVDA